MYPDRLRILLLDEHEQTRSVLRHVLKSRGHVCIAVCSSADALTAMDMCDFDVVVFEPHLREIPSAGLARTFRARATTPGRKLRIVAISALDEPVGFRATEVVDAYLCKPFLPETFVGAIEQGSLRSD